MVSELNVKTSLALSNTIESQSCEPLGRQGCLKSDTLVALNPSKEFQINHAHMKSIKCVLVDTEG